ncbi:MAG: hypothetical protein E6G56_00365 [Actinobacteria bacterium]|nr:MAG: hypothetical protein E6G56_00365 [Actinomycetota bacterium]
MDLVNVFDSDPDYHSRRLGQVVGRTLTKDAIKGPYVLSTGTGSPAREAKLVYGDSIQLIEGPGQTPFGDVCDILQSASPCSGPSPSR